MCVIVLDMCQNNKMRCNMVCVIDVMWSGIHGIMPRMSSGGNGRLCFIGLGVCASGVVALDLRDRR